ncbi:MAG: MscL family protein, partial [Candidatus Eisenbacteria bacterium]|nr:MscL family protein [Candidatus Eisenbacteria bacterium]
MLKKVMAMLEGLNAMSLALGVIIGGAIGKVVGSLTSDVLMPLVSMVIPGGSWRNAELVLKRSDAGEVVNAIKLGTFLGTVIDFLII